MWDVELTGVCVFVCLFAYVCTSDTQILASGSVQIPRFTLLESGGLQIQPVVLQDTGMYTCYAANSEGAINASASLTVWSKRNTLNLNPSFCHRIKEIKGIVHPKI